jgi:hypothetical protein
VSFTGHGGIFHIPLGEWLAQIHCLWEWHYCEDNDTLYWQQRETITAYTRTTASGRVRSHQEYHFTEDVDQIPNGRVPANVLALQGDVVHRRSIGTPRTPTVLTTPTFWEFLKSLGGEWMWDYIKKGEADVSLISAALTAGTFIGMMDGSYNRVHTGTVSGSGWIICCTKTKQLLWGSFYKILPKAASYRGELLGLVALHTLIVAVAKHFQLATAVRKICCDNISALGQAGKAQKRMSAGMKHLDLYQAIQTLKCSFQMDMKHSNVRMHQDRILSWSMLTLEQQLNVICDSLANKAVARYLA